MTYSAPGTISANKYTELLLADPDNYELLHASMFRPIHITMQIAFGDQKDLVGAQLGSSYGAYLLFLQEEMGMKGMVGIDVDPIAGKYAEKIGVRVLQHDARALPFENASLDVVFSNHFLDPLYCGIIDAANGLSAGSNCPSFFRDVLKEIYRVLKPSGIYIMQNELPDYYRTRRSYLSPFSSAEVYPPEALLLDPMLGYIAVLQK